MENNNSNSALDEPAVAAIVSRFENNAVLRWYAQLLGDRKIHIVAAPLRKNHLTVPGFCSERHTFQNKYFTREIATIIRKEPLHLLLADWTNGVQNLSSLLECLGQFNIPSLIIRQTSLEGIKRVVVTSAGGPHTLQQMWIAGEIAAKLSVPIQIIRLRRIDKAGNHNGKVLIEEWTSRMLGADSEPIETGDLADGLAACVEPGDLLIMGAPGPFHQSDCISDSLPAYLAGRINIPMIMMLSGKTQEVTIRSLLWGGLVRLNMRAPGKAEAIRQLVDSLVTHYQVPGAKRNLMIDLAMRRERVMSTAVDCQTAFPHVRLPGFRGLACCLGIFPEGVAFDCANGQLTRFVFLMVTNDGFCDEYLAFLAKLAKRMVRQDIRSALLECTSPEKVLDLLDPQQTTIPRMPTLPLLCRA